MRVRPVLLLTDHPDDGVMYVTGLAKHGFRVELADLLDDMADAIRATRPDAIVLDMKLGDPRTWSRLETIRCGALLDVPGILLTGSIRPDGANRVRARDIGCAAFVAKPCIPDHLAPILHAVISGDRGLIVRDAEKFAAADGVDIDDGEWS
jgi:DNA-binding response OmpR family regulator